MFPASRVRRKLTFSFVSQSASHFWRLLLVALFDDQTFILNSFDTNSFVRVEVISSGQLPSVDIVFTPSLASGKMEGFPWCNCCFFIKGILIVEVENEIF